MKKMTNNLSADFGRFVTSIAKLSNVFQFDTIDACGYITNELIIKHGGEMPVLDSVRSGKRITPTITFSENECVQEMFKRSNDSTSIQCKSITLLGIMLYETYKCDLVVSSIKVNALVADINSRLVIERSIEEQQTTPSPLPKVDIPVPDAQPRAIEVHSTNTQTQSLNDDDRAHKMVETTSSQSGTYTPKTDLVVDKVVDDPPSAVADERATIDSQTTLPDVVSSSVTQDDSVDECVSIDDAVAKAQNVLNRVNRRKTKEKVIVQKNPLLDDFF
jgi:hypothetical protein